MGGVRLETGVKPAACHKLFVAALLDNSTLVHHDDAVGSADGRETVGDHQGRALPQQLFQGLLNDNLGVRVDVGRRLVQDYDSRIRYQCPREADELALAYAQIAASLMEVGVVALFELYDELVGLDRFGRPNHVFIRSFREVVPDVLADAARE